MQVPRLHRMSELCFIFSTYIGLVLTPSHHYQAASSFGRVFVCSTWKLPSCRLLPNVDLPGASAKRDHKTASDGSAQQRQLLRLNLTAAYSNSQRSSETRYTSTHSTDLMIESASIDSDYPASSSLADRRCLKHQASSSPATHSV